MRKNRESRCRQRESGLQKTELQDLQLVLLQTEPGATKESLG